MRLILFIIAFSFSVCINAQKKEISQAQTYIKSGKDFDKAEQLMQTLLQKQDNRNNMKIYITLFESVRKQYEQNNENLFLRQKADTASLFTNCYKMFCIVESMDTLDAKPDKKGRVSPKYRKRNAEYLDPYRLNLFYGGAYYIRHQQYRTAFDFFKKYIDCATSPFFTGYNYLEKDKHIPEAAYWTTFCGYKMNDADRTLQYKNLALKDSTVLSFTLQYMAEAYLMKKDTTNYLSTLKVGFGFNPQFQFFFPRLIDYYTTTNQLDSAMAITDKALAVNDSNIVFRFAKSSILLNEGKYKESIDLSDSIIAKDDSLADAYFNAGTAYLNMALTLEESSRPRKKDINNAYKKARTYIERYRLLAPDEKDKWAPALYRIYLKLNMGKQFDEIDKLMH